MPKILGLSHGGTEGSKSIVVKDKFWRSSKQFTDTFIVLADNLAQSEDDILETPGIPSIGSLYGNGFCVNKTAKDIGTVIHPNTNQLTAIWEVTVECSTEIDSQTANEAVSQDPTDFRKRERWSKEVIEEVRGYDAVGTKIQTPAFEPIEFSLPVTVPVLEITRYERPPVQPMNILKYVNKVNSHPFRGVPKGCALMDSIEYEEEWIDQSLYIRATYVIKFKVELNKNGQIKTDVEGWNVPILAEGHYYFPDNVPMNKRTIGARKEFKSKSGDIEKRNLTVHGYENRSNEPQFLYFKKYGYANFNELNL